MIKEIKQSEDGERRFVFHFLQILRKDEMDSIPSSINKPTEMYEMAVNKSKPFGGKKYRGKDFGGGIVLKSPSIEKVEETIDEILHPKIITSDMDSDHLIPVHLNATRDDKYFYGWSSDAKGWIRIKEIPESLKIAYEKPVPNSNYK